MTLDHRVPTHREPLQILAVDVGAGTQDVFVFSGDREPENCPKLVLPSQTQVVGGRIRRATAQRRPVHLTGTLMGGGESGYAVRDHLAAGLRLTATPAAARTVHNDLDRVEAMGVELREDAPADAVVVACRDVDLDALGSALARFEVALPEIVAVAVQDHGDPLLGTGRASHGARGRAPQPPPMSTSGSGRAVSVHNDVRFEYLQGLLDCGANLAGMVYREPPAEMTRMAAVRETVPGAYLMDTGAAAVLGALGDPVVARAAGTTGAILVNVGNMHTFAVLLRGRRLYGLFEHHTGGLTTALIGDLVERLRTGTLDTAGFRQDFDGHGAALDPAYATVGPFPFVAVTGPNRRLVRPLGYHEAAPHGDMMLAGAYGLVEGVLLAMAAAGHDPNLTLTAIG